MLNSQQKEAVETIKNPLLIIAGAGSGKTTVVVHRIAYLLENGISPRAILAVTFTNKAANEMKERVADFVGQERASQLHISTFHSFCLQILKFEKKHLDSAYQAGFEVSDPSLSKSLLRQLLKGRTQIKPQTILNHISMLKNEMIDVAAFEQSHASNPFIDWKKCKEVFAAIGGAHLEVLEWAYPAYEKMMNEKGFIDFDSLILETIHLFLKRPDILKKYQERFQYIMVDEYQDTNRSQYALTTMLAQQYRNIAVVGDDRQSIYRFRGADIRNILNFDDDYPDAKIINLKENYRSTQTILQASNELISNNTKQKGKPLFTKNKKGDPIQCVHAGFAEDESFYIANEIKELVRSGAAYRDIAVLFRRNSQSADVETALTHEHIPNVLLSGLGFFEREEIQDIVNYLAFIHNTKNIAAFERIIRKPKRRIAEKTIEKLLEISYDKDLLEALKKSDQIVRMQKKAKEEAGAFIRLIEKHQKMAHTHSLRHVIESLLRDIKYQEKVLNAYELHIRKDKQDNINKLLEMIAFKEMKLGRKLNLTEFLEDVFLFNTSSEEQGDHENKVKLMTMHGSKGLEFPYVFIVGFNDELFPASFIEQLDEIEEERRLCYVAFTRAKEKLYLTHAKQRILKSGKIKSLRPSPFLYEFSESLISHVHF